MKCAVNSRRAAALVPERVLALTAAIASAMTVTVLLHAQTAAPETPRFTCTSTRFSNFSTRSGRYSTRLRVRRLQIGMPLAHPYEEVA